MGHAARQFRHVHDEGGILAAAAPTITMTTDWFSTLTGFPERSWAETKASLSVAGAELRSLANNRTFAIGTLETPSVADLRARALADLRGSSNDLRGSSKELPYDRGKELPGTLRVSSVVADVSALHRDPAHRHALFQVASQFNLLEMTGPHVTPEDGVSRYAHDRTQGPACAIAAGAASIYRNYFVPVDGGVGQTRHRQIDCLRDIGDALGNDRGSLWTMRNGYALCTESGLAAITRRLGQMPADERDALRDRLRVGVHQDVEVTISDDPGQRVTQVFCSALPVAYTGIPAAQWTAFATLVLEGAYEATLWAGVLNARAALKCRPTSEGGTAPTGCRQVWLTSLGGGAFGNDPAWIAGAMRRALRLVRDVDLDVRIVSYGRVRPEVERVVAECQATLERPTTI
jgi:hypothetical protein